MASTDEINAGFVVLKNHVRRLIGKMPSIPFIDLQGQATAKLESKEGTRGLVEGVTDILEAAEKVRAKEAK